MSCFRNHECLSPVIYLDVIYTTALWKSFPDVMTRIYIPLRRKWVKPFKSDAFAIHWFFLYAHYFRYIDHWTFWLLQNSWMRTSLSLLEDSDVCYSDINHIHLKLRSNIGNGDAIYIQWWACFNHTFGCSIIAFLIILSPNYLPSCIYLLQPSLVNDLINAPNANITS